MSGDFKSPVVLISLSTEGEAVLVCQALRDAGISAQAVGGSISGFIIALPAQVDVLVESDQLEQAKQALAEIRTPLSEHDWSEVDVGEAEPESEVQPVEEPSIAEPIRTAETEIPPDPAKVIRGRRIFVALLVGDLLLMATGFAQLGLRSWWSIPSVAFGLLLWYACWRGYRWAIGLQTFLRALGFIGGCFPPYVIEGYWLLPSTILDGIIAFSLILSPSLKEFLRYRRSQGK